MPDTAPAKSTRAGFSEVIVVDDHADEVVCDGGDSALGHPRVWYSFDGQDHVECGYCDRLFVKNAAKNRFFA